jgi:hypothetical protein
MLRVLRASLMKRWTLGWKPMKLKWTMAMTGRRDWMKACWFHLIDWGTKVAAGRFTITFRFSCQNKKFLLQFFIFYYTFVKLCHNYN